MHRDRLLCCQKILGMRNPLVVFVKDSISLIADAIRNIQPHVFQVIKVVLFLTVVCRSCLIDGNCDGNGDLVFVFQDTRFSYRKINIFGMNELTFLNEA